MQGASPMKRVVVFIRQSNSSSNQWFLPVTAAPEKQDIHGHMNCQCQFLLYSRLREYDHNMISFFSPPRTDFLSHHEPGLCRSALLIFLCWYHEQLISPKETCRYINLSKTLSRSVFYYLSKASSVSSSWRLVITYARSPIGICLSGRHQQAHCS